MAKEIQRINVREIRDPSIVKTLDSRSLKLLCHDLRKEIIEACSVHGGHLASNLGVVELIVALYRFFDFPKDKLIFDVGHQCYAHKLLTGRSLDHLNENGGVSGFLRRDESIYDCFEAGHSSTSLSAAEAFAIARDLKGEKYNVIALIGDASIANGLAFEALNNIGCRRNKVIVILNDNHMSISRPIGGLGRFFRKISTAKAYNHMKAGYRRVLYRTAVGRGFYQFTYFIKRRVKQMLVPTTMFDNMGFTYMGPVDGHNIHLLEKAFKGAENATKSVVIHVHTIKGKGYEPAEKDKTGEWHGVPPFDIETGLPKDAHEGQIAWPSYMGDLIHTALESVPNTLLICPAMEKGSKLESCFTDFPERSFDVGIAEEHAVTMAGSLSLTGYHPILSIYSTFLQRGFDELLHDCARIHADMTLCIDRAGLVGKDGETHMGIYDEAYLAAIPNVTVSMPGTFSEAKRLMALSLEKGHGVFAIRYPNAWTKNPNGEVKSDIFDFGDWKVLTPIQNDKSVILAVGPKGEQLFSKLLLDGYQANFVRPLFLNPIDEKTLEKFLVCPEIIVYDPYGTTEGFTKSVEKYLFEHHYVGKFRYYAVPQTFVSYDSVDHQEKRFGLSVDQVSLDIERK